MSSARDILEKVASGEMTPEEAELQLKMKPFVDLGFAKPDLHRGIRQGVPEVIYGEGKTPDQIDKITESLLDAGVKTVLITRLSEDKSKDLKISIKYYKDARIGVAGGIPEVNAKGKIIVACAGTSDLPVAEEAAVTAELLGNKVDRIYDVGVAGLQRLLSHTEELMSASVIIAVAGMEGALASVIGGLVDCPVIAVPTSVGYGASFEGLTALLAMMNSCASGVTVVNIDNGFGAGYSASMINHMGG
ncbi:MAG: nickel pincer cofactor biosynthesis protein LarB [Saccharofermentans sp.]|nr:nickel pincer cofactor biosynthesis protein LarB [Clostridiales bacterium]MCR5384279.1 nickel pincer cofactor biosynthesis protein LarB [Saccharofermentans sp.]